MDGFLNLLRSLGSARLVAMSTVAAALIAFFAYLTVQITEPPMALLYSGLDVKDSSAIVEKLTNMGVNHKISPDGSSVMVPEDRVAGLRMSMAQDGLPSGGNIGYEIFDEGDSLGTTSFVQNINRLRALEGELGRSIRSIERIRSARVHLVLPERRLFSREERQPSASIIIKSQGRLNAAQVAAIQNLVAAAVPSLEPGRVSIVDERGTLLAAGVDSTAEQAFVNNVDERRRAYETQLKSEIEALLANSLGPGKVRAEVSAEINFDRTTTNAEIYDPDSQVIRSTQTIEEESASSESSGGEVSVANNLPGNQSEQGSGAKNASQNSRTEETINYEISKTMRTEIQEAGRIQNLSVAILVDGKYVEGANGEKSYQSRSEEELDKIETLVKSAIGYDEERGDTVKVVNMQFAEVEPLPMPEGPSTVFGMARSDFFRLAQLIVLAVVAALVILLVVRPLIIRILASLPPPQANKPGDRALAGATGGQTALPGAEQHALESHASAGELTYGGAQEGGEAGVPQRMSENSVQQAINVASIDGQVQESAVRKIGEVVQRHPDEAVSIIRNWLYNE